MRYCCCSPGPDQLAQHSPFLNGLNPSPQGYGYDEQHPRPCPCSNPSHWHFSNDLNSRSHSHLSNANDSSSLLRLLVVKVGVEISDLVMIPIENWMKKEVTLAEEEKRMQRVLHQLIVS